MIIHGLHGFGTLPLEGSSPAYIRFLPEKGGAGIEALYQEIRDFINTPGRTNAEIEQAMAASGVSSRDVQNAFKVPGEKIVDTKQETTPQPAAGTNLAFLAAIAASYFILGA